ncbi:MAG: response regulator, partial [Treponema sp.]|nr:response regulator [Treponema sp.]
MYNILLTDDEQIMIDSLTFIINKNFMNQAEIFTATSGTEALEIVAKNNIDIIFMDINMPGLNGLETVRYIKHSRPDSVVIILSAFDEFQYAQEAVNLGAFKYLTKPVNRNVVIDTIRSAMDSVEKKRGHRSDVVELHKKLD